MVRYGPGCWLERSVLQVYKTKAGEVEFRTGLVGVKVGQLEVNLTIVFCYAQAVAVHRSESDFWVFDTAKKTF